MNSISYGLNLTKKPSSSAARTAPGRGKPIFGDDESDPEDSGERLNAEEDIGGGVLDPSSPALPAGGPSARKSAISSEAPVKRTPKPAGVLYGDLSAAHASKKHAKEATAVDPTIYDYDSVYDSLHASKKKTSVNVDEETARKPKYIGSLLAAAEVRKKDQLRAKEKLLAKEREEEGDEFADKEKFVTGAYKAQQEEMKRLEEEERKREEEEQARRGKLGMQGFYKGILDKDEKRHEEVIKAVQEAVAKGDGGDASDGDKEKTEEELAKELNERQAGRVILNDEGQVVDKRQLLSAGLNVAPKPKPSSLPPSSAAGGQSSGFQAAYQGRGNSQKAMRERQTRMLEAQLAQQEKRAAEEDDEKQKLVERAAKSRKTEGDISSARERYLQRKREAAAQASSATISPSG